MMIKVLISMVSTLALVGLANANDTPGSDVVAKTQPDSVREAVSYDVIGYDPHGGKQIWSMKSAVGVGLPFTIGMDGNQLTSCDFEEGPVRSTVELSMPTEPGVTVQLVPVRTYANGVLTVVDITRSAGATDRESKTLTWEAGGKQHACVTNEGSYQVSRTVTTLHLDYGKATQVKLSDQSVFEITASAAGKGNTP